ncbi:hypothetical protein PG991_012621 [Apiospora marii]|uniref:Zn(2)-C6 fungal-type domain-containing protein n=1 Tax=Apiospora marii TaxID=335849 RepID=A0ABR1RBA3_9PEZI
MEYSNQYPSEDAWNFTTNASQNAFFGGFNFNTDNNMNNMNNMGSMDLSMNGTESMFNNPEFNNTGNNMPNGFLPAPNMGNQYLRSNPLMGHMRNTSINPALPTMDLGPDNFGLTAPPVMGNTFKFSQNNDHTMQAFGQQYLHQNQGTFMGLGDNLVNPADLSTLPQGTLNNEAADNFENSSEEPSPIAKQSYPSPENLENSCYPIPQEQANGTSSQAYNSTNTTSTSGTIQPNNTSGVISTPPQVINDASSSSEAAILDDLTTALAGPPASVSAPAPAVPAKRGRKRKATSSPEPDATAQSPAKKLRLNACLHCRKQKVKCDSLDNKPCSKCLKAGKQCIIDGQDRRTKQTNLAGITEKLERKHYLAIECMCLITRATASKARFEFFKSIWKRNPNATQALMTLSTLNEPQLPLSEQDHTGYLLSDAYIAAGGMEQQDVLSQGLREIFKDLKSISAQRVKVKDMRPLKDHLKKVAHWVLAEAYRALHALSQQDADAVVGEYRYNPYLGWMHTVPCQMDLSDNADALNKSYLRRQAQGQKLNPTYLKGFLLPPMAQTQLPPPVVQEQLAPAVQQGTPPPSSPNNSASGAQSYIDNGANSQGSSVALSGSESMPTSNSADVSGQPVYSDVDRNILHLLDSDMQGTAMQPQIIEDNKAPEPAVDVTMTTPQSSEDDQAMPSPPQQSEDEVSLDDEFAAAFELVMPADSAEQSDLPEEPYTPGSPMESLFGDSAEQVNPPEEPTAPGSPHSSLPDASDENSDDDVDMDDLFGEGAAEIDMLLAEPHVEASNSMEVDDEDESEDSEMSEEDGEDEGESADEDEDVEMSEEENEVESEDEISEEE